VRTRPPKSWLARATWWVRHPLIAALLVSGLVIALTSLDGTTAGVISRLTGANVDVTRRAKEVYLYRPPTGGYIVIDPDRESMDRLIPLLQTEAHRVIHATSVLRVERWGWGFPTGLTIWRTLEVLPVRGKTPDGGLSFTDEDLDQARKAFLAWLRIDEAWEFWAVKLGDRERLEQLDLGNLARNVGVVALAIATLLALAGMPRYVRVWWATRRLARGECAVCRYDLRGAALDGPRVRCPECGTEWGVMRGKGTARLGFPPAESA